MAAPKHKTKKFKTLTEQQRKELPELAGRLTKMQLAAYFGMNFNTFDRILKDEPEVQELMEQGQSKTIDDVGKALVKKALSGDVNAMKFYLERYAGRIPESVVKQETKEVKTFSDMYDDDIDEDDNNEENNEE